MNFFPVQIIIFLLLAVGTLPTSCAQTIVEWSQPISVADASYGYRAPKIALLKSGAPIIYWGKQGINNVMFTSTFVDNEFSEPVEINTDNIEPDLWNGALGPEMVTNGNVVFLVFEKYGNGIYCSRSFDGGINFEPPVLVHAPGSDRLATLPTLSLDSNGNPIVGFITTNHQESEALYEIARSEDQGLSFQSSVVANRAAGGEVCECCPASLQIINEQTILVFRNNQQNVRDIWAAGSDDGVTFDKAVDLDDVNWYSQVCPNSGPKSFLMGDSILSVYMSGGSGKLRIYESSFDIHNMQKGFQRIFPGQEIGNESQDHPRICGNNDTIGLVWQEIVNGSWDVLFSYSTDGFSQLLNNISPVGFGLGAQRYPDIKYRNEIFHIVYEDPATGSIQYRSGQIGETTSSQEPKAQQLLKFYPNPSDQLIHFEIPGHKVESIQLYNALGKKVNSFKVENAGQIDIGSLKNGLYTINIKTASGIQTGRFIKI